MDAATAERIAAALQEARRRLAAAEQARHAAIAVVGMSCRLPQADDVPSFWRLLRDGTDATGEMPANRWPDEYFDALYTRRGGFLQRDMALFDAPFFGMSPREAETVDPQHRLLLELSQEAFESAGWVPQRNAATQGGVFVGITGNEYGHLLQQHADQIDAHFVAGTPLNAAAGRLAYRFGLTGPTLSVDTACSSSLVALHLALHSLRANECAFALVGGINLILTPGPFIATCRAQMLSRDGRCKAFDARADGYARGEGGVVLILKRLEDAQQANDPIWAVIRASALNQDGPSSGLTVPNGPAQTALIRTALAQAKLSPQDIDALEAHGTGTALGDPIEMHALGAALGTRPADRPLWVSSVKSNVGHLESAAGLTGVLKAILQVYHGELVPHLHFQTPNPRIDWASLAVRIPVERQDWPHTGTRRIGVSSFGASGTNAHVIVESASHERAPRPLKGPTVSFQRQRCWLQPPWPGRRSEGALVTTFTREISAVDEWDDHRVGTDRLLSAATMASWLVGASPTGSVREMRIMQSLTVTATPVTVQISLQNQLLTLSVRRKTGWQTLATAQVSEAAAPSPMHPAASMTQPGTALYDNLAQRGLAYGTSYRVVQEFGVEPPMAWGTLRISTPSRGLAAPLLDGAWHLVAALLPTGDFRPIAVPQLTVYRHDLAVAQAWVTCSATTGPFVECEFGLFDGQGVIAQGTVQFQQPQEQLSNSLYERQFVALPSLSGAKTPHCEIVGDPVKQQAFADRGIYSKSSTTHWLYCLPDVVDSEALLALLRALQQQWQRPTVPHLWLCGRDLTAALGLWRSAAKERPEINMTAVEIADGTDFVAAMQQEWRDDATGERFYRGGKRETWTLKPWQPLTMGRWDSDGVSLDGLRWCPLTKSEVGANQVRIEVAATGLNFKDGLHALGALGTQNAPLGLECAGVIRAVGTEITHLSVGERVMAVLTPGSLATEVVVDARFVLPLPSTMTFAQAATLPLAYLTAWYALERLAKLQPGERILIHAAAGGVGQLALQVAQKCGATIYATASPPKWAFLQSQGVEWIGNSRDPQSLDPMPSVDVVLNALTGDFIPKSLAKLRENGRFIELGKRDLRSPEQVSDQFPSRHYLHFDLGDIGRESPDLIATGLQQLATEITQKTLFPPQFTAWDFANAPNALRALATGQTVGKAVVTRPLGLTISPNKRYLVTGGTGGIGRALVKALQVRGAQSIAVTTRQTEARCIEGVDIFSCNLNDLVSVNTLIAETKPDVIFHLAGQLDDALLSHLTASQWSTPFHAKVNGAWHLHTATQTQPLDNFVIFGSAVGYLGNVGQANYAAANAALDALHRRRTELGQPCTLLHWGPWTLGMGEAHGEQWRTQGLTPWDEKSGIDQLFSVLEHPPLSPLLVINGALPAPPFRSKSPQTPVATAPTASSSVSWLQQIEALPEGLRLKTVRNALREWLGQALHLDPQRIQDRDRLFDLGVDSLLAMDLKNRLSRHTGLNLSPTVIFDFPTVDALADHLLSFVKPSTTEALTTTVDLDHFFNELENLDESDVKRRFTPPQ